MKNRESRGMAFLSVILSLLIVAVIILAALMLYKGSPTPENSVTSPIERGKAVQCLAQVRRVELAIRMYQANKGTYPSSLDELETLSSEDFYCPVTGSPFDYDPRTGKVTCPDHTR